MASKRPGAVKPVKAWALHDDLGIALGTIHVAREDAMRWVRFHREDQNNKVARLIRVIVRPLPPRKRRRKAGK